MENTENGPFEVVSPIKNGDIPASYVSLPEGNWSYGPPIYNWYPGPTLWQSWTHFNAGTWNSDGRNGLPKFSGKRPIVSSILWSHRITRWWFQRFFIFTPIWGNDPIWLIFFKGVETTNLIKICGNSFWQLSIYGFLWLHFHEAQP